MPPHTLTDSDNWTFDDLVAVFELADQQNLEAVQYKVSLLLQKPIIKFELSFFYSESSLSFSGIKDLYPSLLPLSNIVRSILLISSQWSLILSKPITTLPVGQTNFKQQQIPSCVKRYSYAGVASTGGKYVNMEPVVNATAPRPPFAVLVNITIITRSKPTTVAKVPVIKIALTTSAAPVMIIKTGFIERSTINIYIYLDFSFS